MSVPPRPPLRERLARLRGTFGAALLLLAVAGFTQWLLWLRREPDPDEDFMGPPRSDYVLTDFALEVHGDDGRRAFAVVAPRLVKHPALDTLDLERPTFRIEDRQGGTWRVRARRGWVSADADVLRLEGQVAVARPATEDRGAVALDTERLVAHVNARVLTSDVAVTVRQPGSILRGTGLHADLARDRFVLEHQATARYDPTLR